MYDYIRIGAWRSDSVPGLHVMAWDQLLMPRAERAAAALPGRMDAVMDARRGWQPEPLGVTLALVGASRAQIREQYRAISKVLSTAEHIVLSDMPACHYRGYVSEIRAEEDYDEWIRFRVTFQANPPCLLRCMSQQEGWIPSCAMPVPEQITDQNASRALDASGAVSLATVDGSAAYAPEIYLTVTGTWAQLNIGGGGLVLPAQTGSQTVYIDGPAQVAYTMEGGIRTAVAGIQGSYAAISQGTQLTIGGNSISAHIRLLVIERS